MMARHGAHEKVRRFLGHEDERFVLQGLELLRSLQAPELYQSLLHDCRIEDGVLRPGRALEKAVPSDRRRVTVFLALIADAPETIGGLDRLKELDLKNNQLDTIPETLARSQHLETLDLRFNKEPTIPESLLARNIVRS